MKADDDPQLRRASCPAGSTEAEEEEHLNVSPRHALDASRETDGDLCTSLNPDCPGFRSTSDRQKASTVGLSALAKQRRMES